MWDNVKSQVSKRLRKIEIAKIERQAKKEESRNSELQKILQPDLNLYLENEENTCHEKHQMQKKNITNIMQTGHQSTSW